MSTQAKLTRQKVAEPESALEQLKRSLDDLKHGRIIRRL